MTETIRIGGLKLEFLHSKEDTDASVDVFRMTVQPNARVPVPHYHETWDETVYGLSGRLAFVIDGKEIVLSPGDSAFIKRGVVHGFSNPFEEPAISLSVLTPGVLGRTYFREIAELVASGIPNPVRMKEIMLNHKLIPVLSVA